MTRITWPIKIRKLLKHDKHSIFFYFFYSFYPSLPFVDSFVFLASSNLFYSSVSPSNFSFLTTLSSFFFLSSLSSSFVVSASSLVFSFTSYFLWFLLLSYILLFFKYLTSSFSLASSLFLPFIQFFFFLPYFIVFLLFLFLYYFHSLFLFIPYSSLNLFSPPTWHLSLYLLRIQLLFSLPPFLLLYCHYLLFRLYIIFFFNIRLLCFLPFIRVFFVVLHSFLLCCLSCSWNCKKYSVLIHTHGERPGSSVSSWLPDHHAAKRSQEDTIRHPPEPPL